MANKCANYIVIKGEDRETKRLMDMIKSLSKYLGCTEIDEPQEDHMSPLICTCVSRWSEPSSEIETLASMYPKLTFSISYEEPGTNYFGKIVWANGIRLFSKSYVNEFDYRYSSGDFDIESIIEVLPHDLPVESLEAMIRGLVREEDYVVILSAALFKDEEVKND